jgi:hypothetical protein
MAAQFRELDRQVGSIRYSGHGRFAPTLVVGVGGSGTETARRIKRIINGRYGEYDIIRYLLVDTDQHAYAPTPGLAEATPEEQASIVGANAASVYEEMREGYWKPISAFLPDSVDVSVLRHADGAGGIRPVGRFALFSEFSNFYSQLSTACRNVLMVEHLVAAVLQGARNHIHFTSEPRVYLISSICGGTGSSVFLDTAILTRHIFRESGVDPAIIGVFYLPSVFEGEAGIQPSFAEMLRANGYAALRELEAFSEPSVRDAGWTFEYPNIGGVPIERPVFDECYLVEGFNATGQHLPGKKKVFEMTARSICVDMGSPVGARARSARRNTGAVVRLNPCLRTGKPRLMNSLATTSLRVPVEDIARQGALHLAREAIHDHLLGAQPSLQTVENRVTNFLRSNHLEERGEQDLLLERLLRDADGQTLTYVPSRTREALEAEADRIGHRGEAAQARYVANWLTNALTDLKKDDQPHARALALANAPQVLREASDAVAKEVSELLERQGIAGAEAFLTEVRRILEVSLHELTTEAAAHDEIRGQIETGIASRCAFLRDYGSLIDLVLRPHEDEATMEDGLRLLAEYGTSIYKQQARNVAIELLNSREGIGGETALIPRLQEWERKVQNARRALEAGETLIATLLAHHVQNEPSSGYVLEQQLVPPSEYAKYVEGVPLTAASLADSFWREMPAGAERLKALGDNHNRPEELVDRIASCAAGPIMMHLETTASVLEVIRKRKAAGETEAEYISQQVKLMFEICRPFWTTPKPPGRASYEEFLAVTIPTRQSDPAAGAVKFAVSEVIKQAGRNPEIVETDYPFALEISARSYGARAYYLRTAMSMKQQYDARESLPEGSLLHIDKRFGARLPRLHPGVEEQAQLLFAWAVATGFIAKRGEHYYFGAESSSEGGVCIQQPRYPSE